MWCCIDSTFTLMKNLVGLNHPHKVVSHIRCALTMILVMGAALILPLL
jgi:hypothetical protein